MHTRQLDTTKKTDVARWVGFPFELYRGCELWVPPLRNDAAEILQREKHPFYEHSTGDFFVVESAGRTLGRVMALENSRFNQYRGTRAAFFGYFECVDEREVAERLLEAACRWARERGLEEIIGPRGVIGVDGSVLVEGFENRPALAIPYNYPYYDALIRHSGFEKDADYLSGYLPGDFQVPEKIERIAARVRKRGEFRIKSFRSRRELRRWIPDVLKVHHEAFKENHTYYPPSEAEARRVIDMLLTIVDVGLLKLVLRNDEIVGFIFAYQDITGALRKIGGRLWPLGWARVLWERRRTPWVNVNGLGLLPAHRGRGANTLLYTELDRAVKTHGFEHIEVVQVAENNGPSRADMEKLGVRWYKRHRHYRRTL
jgi:GNAT superfamily N-acetyltransferase